MCMCEDVCNLCEDVHAHVCTQDAHVFPRVCVCAYYCEGMCLCEDVWNVKQDKRVRASVWACVCKYTYA